MATRYNINDFALANPAYVGGTVSFWTVSGGVKTATLATLYAGSTGATALTNPRTLDSDGKFSVPVYVEVPVIATVSGLTISDHDTGIMGLAEGAAATSAAAALVSENNAETAETNAAASAAAAAASAASITLPLPVASGGTGSINAGAARTALSAAASGANGDITSMTALTVATLAANPVRATDLQAQTLTAYTTGGSSTAYTLTPAPAISALVENQEFDVEFHTAAGATPTLAISGLTAKDLKYRDPVGTKTAVTSLQIPSGWRSRVTYDGTDYIVREIPTASATTGSASSTFTFNGMGGDSAAVTLSWKKTGNWVTLHIPVVFATSGTSSTTFTSNTALAASARPQAVAQTAPINSIRNNGGAVSGAGLVSVGTDGIITIYRDATSAAWTNSSSCGSNNDISITYFVG